MPGRREDSRFISGAGRYTGDLRPEGLLHMAFVRSPHASARIARLDPGALVAAEGVVAVFTAADLRAAGLLDIPGGIHVARPDGRPAPRTDRPALAADRVRFLGAAVAAVVAESKALAVDALELVEVDYQEAPAAASIGRSGKATAAVWDELPDNVAFQWRGGDREATYLIERLMDIAARELGVSPGDLRRRNLIPPSAMPYRTALVFTHDCGEFEGNMDAAERLADMTGFEARRAEASRRDKLRGIGVCNCIESAGGPLSVLPPDVARLSLLTDGRLRVETGSLSVGQGHETVFPQLIAARFGVAAEQVDFHQGDTDALPFGRGNGGSGGLSVGGSALEAAASALATKLAEIAAPLLDAPADTVSCSGGIFRSRDGNRTVSLTEVAASVAPVSDGVAVESVGTFKPPAVTFPNGTHICEVEIDPDSGSIEIVGYSAVEDIGRVVDPVLAEGQIHGGIAQGIGQALGERIVYDEAGQLLRGSFMDYQLPRARDIPAFALEFREVPTEVNPLGVKGVGEAGTVGAIGAVMNAVNDALAPLGVRHLDMPTTPARIWEAIRAAGLRCRSGSGQS